MPLKKLISFNVFASLKDTIEYFNIAKIDKKFITLGAILSFLLMLVNLYSVSLIPSANSLITKDFSILQNNPYWVNRVNSLIYSLIH